MALYTNAVDLPHGKKGGDGKVSAKDGAKLCQQWGTLPVDLLVLPRTAAGFCSSLGLSAYWFGGQSKSDFTALWSIPHGQREDYVIEH